MINVKVAEEVRCKLENNVGKGIWAADLIEKNIWRVIAERKLLLGEDDVTEIAKIVLRSRCGEVFTVAPEPICTCVLGELYDYCDNDAQIFDSYEELDEAETVLRELKPFFDKRNELPGDIAQCLSDTIIALQDIILKRDAMDESIEELTATMSNLIDEVYAAY